MKRILLGLLSLILVIAAAGCAANTEANEASAAPETSSEPTAIPEPDSEPAPSMEATEAPPTEEPNMATLFYQGHGSLRVTTAEGKVIYIDPYAGEGYDSPADLILVTHGHSDHTAVDLIKAQNSGCQTITYEEALVDGEYKTFDLGYVTVEAVEAGNNPNHDITVCVGYILTFSDGKTVYISGDTSTTDQMATLKERNLDYAFFCCDGIYNMDIEEAAACAELVGAKHSIPYHMSPGENFSQERAELFDVPNRLIIADGEEITL
ncbi:MAG: MBL fold metallo-hydrolase [Oscillospiraceae bacterium]|nr:MBL fold metallo-hydrolase [Oscillospiraceae bacterium]